MIDPRIRTLPQTTADHLLARYGAGVREILDIAAVMPGALRPIKEGEPPVMAEVVYAARRELAA